jgi:hypothetical protein
MIKQPVTIKLRSHIPELVIWGVFAVITGISIIHHVMWRDEWQPILISYKSNSWSELWQQVKEEGHPALWYLLMCITKFLGPPTVIPKLLNYISALAYCGIILFYAPFPRVARYALVFGYFFLFEYAVITRDYAICTLLIFAIVALWQNRQKHRWLFAILLFLLTQSSFYTAMMTVVFVIILLTEPLLLTRKWRLNPKDLLPAAFGIAGAIVSYKTCICKPHQPFKLSFDSNHLMLAFDRIYCAFMPIPNFTHNSWNSIIPNAYQQALLSFIIIAAVIYFLRAHKRALLFWVTYVIIQELFTYFFNIGAMRHSGFIFIAAIVAFWFVYLDNPKSVFSPFQKICIGGVLAFQIFIALYFVWVDMREPFSASGETASWLRNNHLDHLPIYSDGIWSTQGVSGYLDKPITDVITKETYFAIRWSKIDYSLYPDSILKKRLQQIVSAHDSSVLLLNYTSRYFTDSLTYENEHIILLKQFSNANIADENFNVYLLKR